MSHENHDDDFLAAIDEQEDLNNIFFAQQEHRQGAREGQQEQARRMLESSRKRYAAIAVGTSVRIPVPDVDRSKVDSRNLMGVVLEEKDGFYKIGTVNGVLTHFYARNQIEPCTSSFLTIDEVPPSEISLRTAVGANSLSGVSQGHVHCNCTGKYTTKKCNCKKLDRQCNSRCHQNRNCLNK